MLFSLSSRAVLSTFSPVFFQLVSSPLWAEKRENKEEGFVWKRKLVYFLTCFASTERIVCFVSRKRKMAPTTTTRHAPHYNNNNIMWPLQQNCHKFCLHDHQTIFKKSFVDIVKKKADNTKKLMEDNSKYSLFNVSSWKKNGFTKKNYTRT